MIKDLTKGHKGKWYEVGVFYTDKEDEELNVIGKFTSKCFAFDFAKLYNAKYSGHTEIVVR